MPSTLPFPSFSVLQVICSYVLRPMVFMMGVQWADCPLVAEIVGVKFFINEFVAYQQLSQYKNKRLSGVEEWINGEKQWISVSDNSANYTGRGLGQAYLREGMKCHTNIVDPKRFSVSQPKHKASRGMCVRTRASAPGLCVSSLPHADPTLIFITSLH